MKRKGYLYKEIYKYENVEKAFNEICKNTRNKNRVELFKENKNIYVSRCIEILKNRQYIPSEVNVFTIHEVKKRTIVSQNMMDKLVNHLVARYILYPSILPSLLDINVVSRKGYGTSKGIELWKKYQNKFNIKYIKYYILKFDISKYFKSINHDILKLKLEKRIKDKEALEIVFKIIDSEKEGLSIGLMSSQILAIFYLSDLDRYIVEKLKFTSYIRYQDDRTNI